ncbi:hypothetical protein ACINK0_03485 [Deinococcus sp. VB343]|uniref:hypothetical protein n=1 Tax=Deinococcus sp. VB343 TaxID=3385567 RepID=UPI0039C99565
MDVQEILDLVAKIEAGLRTRSENGQGSYPEYPNDRNVLLSNTSIRLHIPPFILNSPDADTAFSYMRNHASGTGSWQARRAFVQEAFQPLRDYLNQIETSAVLLIEEDIEQINLTTVSTQLTRAKSLISIDPASAITKAETALATVCKHILQAEGQPIGKTESLPSLVSRTSRDVLKLETYFDVRNFSGISNQGQLVAEIRNRYGDAHPAPTPDDYIAEYAVTIAGSLAILLLKRYEQQKEETNDAS